MANRRQSSRRSAAKNQKDTIYYDEAEVKNIKLTNKSTTKIEE